MYMHYCAYIYIYQECTEHEEILTLSHIMIDSIKSYARQYHWSAGMRSEKSLLRQAKLLRGNCMFEPRTYWMPCSCGDCSKSVYNVDTFDDTNFQLCQTRMESSKTASSSIQRLEEAYSNSSPCFRSLGIFEWQSYTTKGLLSSDDLGTANNLTHSPRKQVTP